MENFEETEVNITELPNSGDTGSENEVYTQEDENVEEFNFEDETEEDNFSNTEEIDSEDPTTNMEIGTEQDDKKETQDSGNSFSRVMSFEDFSNRGTED